MPGGNAAVAVKLKDRRRANRVGHRERVAIDKVRAVARDNYRSRVEFEYSVIEHERIAVSELLQAERVRRKADLWSGLDFKSGRLTVRVENRKDHPIDQILVEGRRRVGDREHRQIRINKEEAARLILGNCIDIPRR